MSVPRYHSFLTSATNNLGMAVDHIEQSLIDSDDPDYKKLHDAAVKLHARFVRKWDRNVKRGRREGWFK